MFNARKFLVPFTVFFALASINAASKLPYGGTTGVKKSTATSAMAGDAAARLPLGGTTTTATTPTTTYTVTNNASTEVEVDFYYYADATSQNPVKAGQQNLPISTSSSSNIVKIRPNPINGWSGTTIQISITNTNIPTGSITINATQLSSTKIRVTVYSGTVQLAPYQDFTKKSLF